MELVSPHHAARELVHTIRQGQITSLFQKSIKRVCDFVLFYLLLLIYVEPLMTFTGYCSFINRSKVMKFILLLLVF